MQTRFKGSLPPDVVWRSPHVDGGEESTAEEHEQLLPLGGRVQHHDGRLLHDQRAGRDVPGRHEALSLPRQRDDPVMRGRRRRRQ